MNAEGIAIIFGLLAIPVGLVVGGIFLKGGLGAIMVTVGIVGAVAWVVFAFHIASALNSDI